MRVMPKYRPTGKFFFSQKVGDINAINVLRGWDLSSSKMAERWVPIRRGGWLMTY